MNTYWLLLFLLLLLMLIIACYPLRKTKAAMIFFIPFLIGATGWCYWYCGSWRDVQRYFEQINQQKQIRALLHTIKTPDALIVQLKNHLAKEPNSARGWYLLGRLYASQNQWSLARDAFTRAYRLQPNDEAINVNYALSLWQLNHQKFNSTIRGVFKKLLKNNKQQPDALAMLAMDAFARHYYQLAIQYWQRLLILVPQDSEEAQMIAKTMIKAQQLKLQNLRN